MASTWTRGPRVLRTHTGPCATCGKFTFWKMLTDMSVDEPVSYCAASAAKGEGGAAARSG
eukprot:769131-Prymnesium_polylepis.1